MSRINSQNFDNAAARAAGAPFEILGKVMTNAKGYAMPVIETAAGGWVMSKGYEMGDSLIQNKLGLPAGDIANRALYGAATISALIGGGALVVKGVGAAVAETQRLLAKEA